MPLAVAFDDPFTSSTVDPPLQSVEFVDGSFVDLFQLLMRGSCLIQYAAKLRHLPLSASDATLMPRGFLKGSQQETLAFDQIMREKVGVIHNANCFSDSCKEWKTTVRKVLANSSIPFSATSVLQIETTQQSVELAAIQFDARLTFGRHRQLENANLEPLVPNAKSVRRPRTES